MGADIAVSHHFSSSSTRGMFAKSNTVSSFYVAPSGLGTILPKAILGSQM